MPAFICTACGTQSEPSPDPPAACAICAEERQYADSGGQAWTTQDALRTTHFTILREEEPGLVGLGIAPGFGIGQRALLLRTPAGNILWDCVSLLDPAAIAAIQALGGLAGIAVSHPHYYTAMVDWAEAFDCSVYLHEADCQWVMRGSPRLKFWQGDVMDLPGGLRLVRAGGHYPGGTILHWPGGAEGRGALLVGDIVQVVPSGWVSFMWSFPNFIPLSEGSVRRVVAAVAPLRYDRIYGAFFGRVTRDRAQAVVARSAKRYIASLQTERE